MQTSNRQAPVTPELLPLSSATAVMPSPGELALPAVAATVHSSEGSARVEGQGLERVSLPTQVPHARVEDVATNAGRHPLRVGSAPSGAAAAEARDEDREHEHEHQKPGFFSRRYRAVITRWARRQCGPRCHLPQLFVFAHTCLVWRGVRVKPCT